MEVPESMVGMGGDLPMDMSIGSAGMSLQARGFGKMSNRDRYGAINHSANESGIRSKRKKSKKKRGNDSSLMSKSSKRSRDGSLRGEKKLKRRNSMIQSILEEDDDHS